VGRNSQRELSASPLRLLSASPLRLLSASPPPSPQSEAHSRQVEFTHSHLSPDQDQPLEDELPSFGEDFNDSGLWRPENEPSLPGVEGGDPPVSQIPVAKTPVNKRLILTADTPACTPLPDYEVNKYFS
jgi:hypothetical protein